MARVRLLGRATTGFLAMVATGPMACNSGRAAGGNSAADGASPSIVVTRDGGGSSGGAITTGDATVPPCTVDADVGAVDAADAAACAAGQLRAAPTTTFTTPDPEPSNPILAASSTGDVFLAVWEDGLIVNGVTTQSIWAAAVEPGDGGATVSTPVEVGNTTEATTVNNNSGGCPVASWNGNGFTIVWGDDTGLHAQQLDTTGALSGAPTQILAMASPLKCPLSLVFTGTALALGWAQGHSPVTEEVALLGPNGIAANPLVLAMLGPDLGLNVGLAQLSGQTYVGFITYPDANANTIVGALDWSGAASGPALSTQATLPGIFIGLAAGGDRLWVGMQGPVYVDEPPGAFTQVGLGCSSFNDFVADACGRLVGLGRRNVTTFGGEGYAQALGGSGSTVTLGGMSDGTIAAGASTYGVLWLVNGGPRIPPPFDSGETAGSLSFTALSWQ